jgi:hypothetical protein
MQLAKGIGYVPSWRGHADHGRPNFAVHSAAQYWEVLIDWPSACPGFFESDHYCCGNLELCDAAPRLHGSAS